MIADDFLKAFKRLAKTGEPQIVGTFTLDTNGRGGIEISQRRTYFGYFLNGQINPAEATFGTSQGGFKFWPSETELARAAKCLAVDEATELARREALARLLVEA